MFFIDKNCLNCKSTFQAHLKEHKRGNAKFCCRKCSSSYLANDRSNALTPNVECFACNTPLYRNPSQLKKATKGYFFCSNTCHAQVQRVGVGPEDLLPSHYGSGSGQRDYRERAFAHYPSECADCGWNLIDEVLEVHHIDRDRSNNAIENLKILCPTCHRVDHFMTRSGLFTYHKIVCEAETVSPSA